MLEQYFFLYKADVCHVKHLKDEVFDIVKYLFLKLVKISTNHRTLLSHKLKHLCNSMKLMNAVLFSLLFWTSFEQYYVERQWFCKKKNMHAVDAVSGPKILIVDNRLQNCGIEQNKLCVCPFHLLVIFEYDEISDLLVKNSPMHQCLRGDLLTWFDMRQFKSNTLCNLHDFWLTWTEIYLGAINIKRNTLSIKYHFNCNA
ncbi:hypothetical protein T05_9374 [Trichinella murrelli]|uniref:Uncharacterized protein n=1 Tax=Trichinella murrelli TaxID=144512 RepID=A0A0V0TL62_9BILA|nr:hypothetical protein T05_9374 [Trichinella murrelli]